MRAHDWATTPLGPIETWSPSLRVAVQLALNSPLPTVVVWGSGLTFLCNDAYRPILGDKPEALGQCVLDVWSEVAEAIEPMLRRALAGEVTTQQDARFILRRHGAPEEAWFDYSFSPIRDETGAIVGVLHQGIETTARVRAERARLESEQRLSEAVNAAGLSSDFRALFEAAPTPLLAVAPPDWTVVAANDARLEVTGTTREGTIGRKLFDLFPDDPNDLGADGVRNLRASLERVLAMRAADAMAIQRYAIRGAEGRFEERWWSPVNTPVLGTDGEVALVIHRVEDVTDIVRMQGQAEARDQLARDQQAVIDRLHSSEDAQRNSEARYRQIVEGAEDFAIVTLDAHGVITGWNTGAERITGFAVADAVGQPGAIFFTPEDRDAGAPDHEMNQAATAGRVSDERWHQRRDGERFWGSGLTMRLDQPGGGYLKIFRDRTAEHDAEAALRENEARFRVLAESIDEVFYLSDLKARRVAYVSPAYGRLWGRSADELYGDLTAYARAIHPGDTDAAQAALAQQARGEPTSVEYRIRGADGVERWIWDRSYPVEEQNGRFAAGVAEDITRRKLAEERLRVLNETLEAQVAERTAERDRMWNTSPDLMVVVDFKGVFRRVNPAWTAVLGYTADELEGHHVNEFVLAEDHGQTVDAYELAASGGRPRIENRYRRKDGSTRWISWVAAPAGDVTYATGRDVTAEKEREAELAAAQEALRQAQKMEAVGQLTGGIAHDFNNLLTGIIGSLDLLQRRAAEGRLDQIGRYTSVAITSAQRAAALTQRLLAFSRRQPLDPKPVDANKLVASMEELLRRTLGPQIELELVLAGGLWPTLCDPNQLESAILNLAINARDAMPGGGRLTVETANAHLDQAYARAHAGEVEPGQYVVVAVTDTGTGIPRERLTRIFEPFFTTKPIGQGTGLGLSQLYGFAKQSGGHVKVYSEMGQGTTFRLYLPRHRGRLGDADPADTSDDMHPPASAYEADETVLVVDDEPAVRMLITDTLEELGYAAVEAVDGPSGLKMLQSDQRIDLLVTDVGLPGLNGRQLADAAREVRPGLKVLFITGYAGNAAIGNGVLDPGMEMLTKPFAMDRLAAKIRGMIGSDEGGARASPGRPSRTSRP